MSDAAQRFHAVLQETLAAPPRGARLTGAAEQVTAPGTGSAVMRRFQAALHEALGRPAGAAAQTTPGTDPAPAATSPLSRRFEEALREAGGRPAGVASARPASAPATSAARRFRAALQESLSQPAEPDGEAAADPGTAASATSALARQFDDTLRRALDPASVGSAGSARTTGYSGWLMKPCPVCNHTVREGDLVWLEQRGGQVAAIHDSAELPCHSGAEPRAQTSAAAAAFSAALRRAYPGIPVRKVIRLRPGHPLLSRQYLTGPARCRGCGHTFRPFERIAICPCRPLDPRDGCRFPAHNDPAASQLCFDLLADPERKHCPRDFSPR